MGGRLSKRRESQNLVGAESQSPGSVLGELECPASKQQELSDSELASGRWLPCGTVNHTLLTRKYVFNVGRRRYRAVAGWLTAEGSHASSPCGG